MAERARAAPWRTRISLLGLFAVFFVPVLAAVVLAVVAPGWMPFGSVNRGELVHPPRPVALREIEALDGGTAPDTESDAVWMLAHVGPAQCDAGCAQALLDMRQARLALGKDARRVARWWLVTGRPEARALAGVRGAYPGMRVGLIRSDSILATQPAPIAAIQLVDPAGLLILRYSGGSVAADVLKDLKRLLKISTQG